MRGEIANLMQQAQKMQEQLKRTQEEIAQLEVEGQAGGGMVRVTKTGAHAVRRVRIEPSLAGGDLEMLEDLVAAACNDALSPRLSGNKSNSSKVRLGATIAMPMV